jgi:N-glycosidase YbiA
MNNTRTILFYRQNDPYGEFSNFSAHPFKLKGKVWPTSEHYFQAQKFAGTEHEETVRNAKTPSMSAKLGRSRSLPLRADWEVVKEDVMRDALRAKFDQHPKLQLLLISTGDAELIEHTQNDRYWADGGDGTGKNRLGILLMELRADLISKVEPTASPTTR